MLLIDASDGCDATYAAKASSSYLSVVTRTSRTRGKATFLLKTAICF
jgi:hypothetical protein